MTEKEDFVTNSVNPVRSKFVACKSIEHHIAHEHHKSRPPQVPSVDSFIQGVLSLGMRTAVARIICYLALAVLIAAATRDAWQSVLFRPEQRNWTNTDVLFFGVENGAFERVHFNLTILPYVPPGGEPEWPNGHLNFPAARAELQVELEPRGSNIDAPSYLVAQGSTARFLDNCVAENETAEIRFVPAEQLAPDLDMAGSFYDREGGMWPPSRRVLEISKYRADSFIRVLCEVDPSLLWLRDRHKHYLSVPVMETDIWERKPIGAIDTPLSQKDPSCPSLSYVIGGHERVDSSTPVHDKTTGGQVDWTSCEAGYGGGPADAIESVESASSTGARRPVYSTVIDLSQESENERNLLAGGIFLGIAGALVVEAVGVILLLAERLAGVISRLLSKHWRRRRPEAHEGDIAAVESDPTSRETQFPGTELLRRRLAERAQTNLRTDVRIPTPRTTDAREAP
ncbi:hypothetical protein AB0M02_14065 [Actinoplanes sp. NPDC051861]|uniref:hypothetical protein n=1 Tax=Actinoplanes sp. NPDC051861 TaxID=3155170 RepID=UPI0034340B35